MAGTAKIDAEFATATATADLPPGYVQAASEAATGLPPVGARVWFGLRGPTCHGEVCEWVQATVIDKIRDRKGEIETELDPPIDDGDLHLEIALDRGRHHAAATRGVRLNVAEGVRPGEWQRSEPAGWFGRWQRAEEQQAVRDEENRARARNGGTV